MNRNDPSASRAALRLPTLPLLSLDYLLACIPLIVWSCYLNGARTLLLVLLGMLCAMIWETISEAALRRRITAWDCSAALDGVLFALMLPVTAPLWVIPIGTLGAVLLFKVLWGGQGKCSVHPAIGAYALLYPFFRTVLTSYAAPGEHIPVLEVSPVGSLSGDLLDSLANGTFPNSGMLRDMLIGNLPGSMGQLSLILLLGGAIYLIGRGHLRLGQLMMTLLGAFITVLLLPAALVPSDAMAVTYSVLQLGCGSLLFLSIFPASHPAYAPRTMRASLIFGIGVGVITGLVRYFELLNDGAVYAVLLMQLLTPLLNRLFRLRHYGQEKKKPSSPSEGNES